MIVNPVTTATRAPAATWRWCNSSTFPPASGYQVYTGSNELARRCALMGYGDTGTGTTGDTGTAGVKQRAKTSLTPPAHVGLPDTMLVYDFDNGTQQNDAFGRLTASTTRPT